MSSLTGPQPQARWIVPAFFLSGFAALIYQVVWQRVLYAAFGINVESVAVVVTAFLLGLGLGSLLGGAMSTRASSRALLLFAGLELSIAAYGLASVPLFRAIASFTAHFSPVGTACVTFGLVLIPTLCMGATLPLLVAYQVRTSNNVGGSVSRLYFVNTAGSALASVLAALFILRHLGEQGSTELAAGINLLVGALVLNIHRKATGQ